MNTTTTHIVRIEKPGGPEVLKYQEAELSVPGPGEVLIAQKAMGVNFLDLFFRNGTFPMPSYPGPVGLEAAGVIDAVGDEVVSFNIGDRVAYYASSGAYAEKRLIKADEIFRLPDDITFEQAAAVMIKGLTARMLLKHSHSAKPGEVVLIHAMTGGVGTLLGAWARYLGATVIGTVGSAAKKQLALLRGYEHVIDLQSEDLSKAVTAITGGKGIDVVYDGVGQATFGRSVALVKPGGNAVLYGWASGMPGFEGLEKEHSDVHFVRAVLNHDPDYQDRSGKGLADIFELIRKGVFYLEEPAVYALRDAAKAHADLESRKTTGSILLKP